MIVVVIKITFGQFFSGFNYILMLVYHGRIDSCEIWLTYVEIAEWTERCWWND